MLQNSSMIKMIGRDATGELCHKALFDKDEHCPWCLYDKVQQGESSEIEIVSITSGSVSNFYDGSGPTYYNEVGTHSTNIRNW